MYNHKKLQRDIKSGKFNPAKHAKRLSYLIVPCGKQNEYIEVQFIDSLLDVMSDSEDDDPVLATYSFYDTEFQAIEDIETLETEFNISIPSY